MPEPRRSPRPDERQRDAERTRRALLDAALEEFAAKGRAGARVSAIAERAGVNKQLISYYFGGKQGLYDALLARWQEQEAAFGSPRVDLEGLAGRYLDAGYHQPALEQLFIRESLEQDVSDVVHDPDAPELVDLRQRQAAGEFTDELDPAFVLLALQSIIVARTVFPGDVKRFTGMDPASVEYRDYLRTQLGRLVRRLADRDPDEG